MLQPSPIQLLWAVILIIFARALFTSLRNHYKLASIPTVGGPSGFFSSYLGAWNSIWNSRRIFAEGYAKYHGTVFKVAQLNRWMIVISSPEMIEDFRKAPREYMNLSITFAETLNTRHTIGSDVIRDNHIEVEAVRGPLTRNIKALFSEVHDEVVAAFADYIPVKDEWTSIHFIDAARHIICRTTNRLFVGLPLCRDPEYMELNIKFTIDLILSAHMLDFFPSVLQPVAAYLFSQVRSDIKKGMRLIGPMVKERLEKEAAEGPDWAGRPNDYLSWIFMSAEEKDKNVYDLVRRVLLINFAAIHTTSSAFTMAAYKLAAYQEYVEPLREEIAEAVQAEGWTKAAMGMMHKLDSFLKESARITGQGMLSTTRLLLKDFTFSNGITLPKGSFFGIPGQAIHDDDNVYPNASTFDGYRFYNQRDTGKFSNQQMVNIHPEYTLFGYGRHACPGRFFAVNEIKLLLAHMLMNYDFKLKDDSHEPPPHIEFLNAISPNTKAHVLFRARS